MKRIISLLLLTCMGGYAGAQSAKYFNINRSGIITEMDYDEEWELQKSNPMLVPYKENGKYGLVNRQGKKVTEAKYNLASPSDGTGLAKVYMEALQSTFVDSNGKEVIPPADYGVTTPFVTQAGYLVLVEKDEKKGLMRPDGSWALQPGEYRTIYQSGPSQFQVRVDERKMLYQMFSLEKGFYGERFAELGRLYNGVMACQCTYGGKWGLMKEDYTMLVPCKWKIATPVFYAGQLIIQDGKNMAAVDKEGKEVPVKYHSVYTRDKSAWKRYKYNNKLGYLDRNGDVIVEAVYDIASEMTDGMAAVKQDSLWGYVDTTGAVKIPPRYKSAGDFRRGMANVGDGTNKIYIDRNGNELSLGEQRMLDSVSISIYTQDGKKGYRYASGKVFVPAQFDDAKAFAFGLAAVKQGDKWGFIDEQGTLVIPFIFGSVTSGFNARGVAWVSYTAEDLSPEGIRKSLMKEAQQEIDKAKDAERKRYARFQAPPPDPNACDACSGMGYQETGGQRCASCGGSGGNTCGSCRGGYKYNAKGESSYCNYCQGSGKRTCYSCFGSGQTAGTTAVCRTCSGSGRKKGAGTPGTGK